MEGPGVWYPSSRAISRPLGLPLSLLLLFLVWKNQSLFLLRPQTTLSNTSCWSSWTRPPGTELVQSRRSAHTCRVSRRGIAHTPGLPALTLPQDSCAGTGCPQSGSTRAWTAALALLSGGAGLGCGQPLPSSRHLPPLPPLSPSPTAVCPAQTFAPRLLIPLGPPAPSSSTPPCKPVSQAGAEAPPARAAGLTSPSGSAPAPAPSASVAPTPAGPYPALLGAVYGARALSPSPSLWHASLVANRMCHTKKLNLQKLNLKIPSEEKKKYLIIDLEKQS